MNLFLLEDDYAIATGLCYSLENEGYSVTLASGVKQAIDIISKEKFSLIFIS